MGFFSRLSPFRAYRDLRFFLAGREPYELGFLALAMTITGVVVFTFLHANNDIEPVYKPNIIYVQQWRADRTDDQIKAQQVVDQRIRDKMLAEQKAEQDKRRAEFKRLDDKLNGLGL